jgi:hypothetical protein
MKSFGSKKIKFHAWVKSAKNRLIGWIGHTLLMQPSKIAHRIFSLFYIFFLISFFKYETIGLLSFRSRSKQCELSLEWENKKTQKEYFELNCLITLLTTSLFQPIRNLYAFYLNESIFFYLFTQHFEDKLWKNTWYFKF